MTDPHTDHRHAQRAHDETPRETGAEAAARAPRVLLGVAGGIAAYKACHLVREFSEHGADVTVVPTPNALRFVGAATFEALSGNPVATDVFTGVDEVRHVRVGQESDLVVIAPATADLIARLAAGRADDLLTASVLVATCPVVVAPAMHTEMWLNAATRDNVATLRRRGITVLDPASGRLTGPDSGPGRLLEPAQIAELARTAAARGGLSRPLEGTTVVISAGGTREALDPVRYLGNRSSGRQGFALAELAGQLGAHVELVAGATDALPTPANTTVTRIESTAELKAAVDERAADADVVIMAAAVSDFRPANVAGAKMKKGSEAEAGLETLQMTENPDILRGVVEARESGVLDADTVIVGFAAETGDADADALEYGRRKLLKKGCDVILCNEVGGGRAFGTPDNAGWLLTAPEGAAAPADVEVREVPRGSKQEIAAEILAEVVRIRHADSSALQD